MGPWPLGVSTDLSVLFGLEDHSFPGTVADADECVAPQLLRVHPPVVESVAAGFAAVSPFCNETSSLFRVFSGSPYLSRRE